MYYMLTAQLFMSLEAFLTKVLQHLGIAVIIYSRALLTFCFLYCYHTYQRLPVYYKNQQTDNFLILRGFIGALGLNCVTFAITHLKLSEAMTIQYTMPIWAGLLAICFLNEKFTFINLCCSICGFCGIIFMLQPEIIFGSNNSNNANISNNSQTDEQQQQQQQQQQRNRVIGIMVAILSSFLNGLLVIIIRKIPKEVPFSTHLLYTALANVLITEPQLLFINDTSSQDKRAFIIKADVLVLLIYSLTGYAGQIFVAKGVRLEKAGVVTVVCYLQIVLAYVYDIAVISGIKNISALSIVGSSFVISAAAFLMYKNLIESKKQRFKEAFAFE